MDAVKRGETRYRDYESLLFERDQAEKEAGQVWTRYIQIFGELFSAVFAEKIECIQRKKVIAYYQRALQSGGTVDAAALQAYLDDEMRSYRAELKHMLRVNKRCAEAGTSSHYETQRSKTLYRRLAKLLHPDLRPETDRDEVLSELWNRVMEAYHHNDVKALSELEVLARRELRERGIDGGEAEIEDIDEKIEELQEEIREITSTEPYTLGALLDDPEAVEQKKKELEEELEDYRRYGKELDAAIRGMLGKGGIRIQWNMD